MFTKGEIPPERVLDIPDNILEMAEESITYDYHDDFETIKNYLSQEYFYEYIRCISVEKQTSQLKEYIEEECDLI